MSRRPMDFGYPASEERRYQAWEEAQARQEGLGGFCTFIHARCPHLQNGSCNDQCEEPFDADNKCAICED